MRLCIMKVNWYLVRWYQYHCMMFACFFLEVRCIYEFRMMNSFFLTKEKSARQTRFIVSHQRPLPLRPAASTPSKQ